MIGVSRGTISAANAAARLGTAGPDGLVLLSPVTAGRHERLADVRIETIAVPTLVVHHRGDACSASPPTGARALVRRLKRATGSRSVALGQRARTPDEADPCEALTRHGYLGVEAEVVDAIVDFVASSH
jgi:pimeloyl-ACP methyl ester carboxylesterase